MNYKSTDVPTAEILEDVGALEGRISKTPGLAEVESEAAARFHSQCITFQKRRAFFIGPAMFVLALWAFAVTRVWQTGAISVVLVFTNFAFYRALATAKKGEVERSLWLSLVPTLLTGLSVILLIEGFGTAMILTAVSIVVQSSVFSKRISMFGAAGVFLLLWTEQMLVIFNWYSRYVVTAPVTFGTSITIGAVMVYQFWVHLRKHHDNNRSSLQQHIEMDRLQKRIIRTVEQIMPSIENSVERIVGVSDEVAVRANSQAEAMDAMAGEVTSLISGAEQTTAHAQKSNFIAAEMQSEMNDNLHRLAHVANAFDEVLRNMRDARAIMVSLVSNTHNIESILSYNRDIGEHIKVLSVNASIEAAAAGEYGAGFAVVARELREMIDSTEKNLFQSRSILNEIRKQSSSGMEAIDATAAMLEQFNSELSHTREILVKSANNAAAASRQLKQIVDSAVSQHEELSSIASRVKMLLDSAFELAISSSNLADIVAQMDDFKQTLNTTLGTSD